MPFDTETAKYLSGPEWSNTPYLKGYFKKLSQKDALRHFPPSYRAGIFDREHKILMKRILFFVTKNIFDIINSLFVPFPRKHLTC